MNLVVSDASPLIALEQIGQLSILEKLVPRAAIIVPPAVAREVAPTARVGSSPGFSDSEPCALFLRARFLI
jgi:predicted nucleic acid-binding protein